MHMSDADHRLKTHCIAPFDSKDETRWGKVIGFGMAVSMERFQLDQLLDPESKSELDITDLTTR